MQIHLQKGNRTSHNENKSKKSINERLRTLSPANQKPKQGIIRSRNRSNTNLSTNYRYQEEINQLNEEIKLLKQTKNHQLEEAKTVKTSNAQANYKKTDFQVSLPHSGQEENIKLIDVINFIKQTMTLC